MQMPIKLYETARNFWHYRNQGGTLYSKLLDCGAELCIIPPETGDLDIGVKFMKIRYTEDEKLQFKWITNEKGIRKISGLISKCVWTIAPVIIQMGKKFVQPEDQIFIYIVQTKLCNYKTGQNIKYISRVETDFRCNKVTRVPYYTDSGQKDAVKNFPTKFPFPRAQIKKINQKLYQ